MFFTLRACFLQHCLLKISHVKLDNSRIFLKSVLNFNHFYLKLSNSCLYGKTTLSWHTEVYVLWCRKVKSGCPLHSLHYLFFFFFLEDSWMHRVEEATGATVTFTFCSIVVNEDADGTQSEALQLKYSVYLFVYLQVYVYCNSLPALRWWFECMFLVSLSLSLSDAVVFYKWGCRHLTVVQLLL